jgi:hypothetical protein
MSRSATKPVLVLAMLYFGTMATGQTVAQVSGNQTGFINSGQTATLDCSGGKAAVVGSYNTLTITGKCSNLDLAGSVNKISIDFGPAAKVNVWGSGNAIIWTSADGKPPTINSVGSWNTLTPR